MGDITGSGDGLIDRTMNHLEQFDMTLDDFKEFLISENFGSFIEDW